MEERGTKALSFQQPWATLIALGEKTVECRSRSIKTSVQDLLVCSSKTARAFYPIPGLAYGYALALVDVVDCVPFCKKHVAPALMEEVPEEQSYAWILENVRPVEPFPVRATASFFYVQEKIVLTNLQTADDYQALYRDIWNVKSDKQNGADVDDTIASLFS